jgi:hypothetical protein
MSRSMISLQPLRCTLTTTSTTPFGVSSVARCTWPMEAVASGFSWKVS